MFNQVLTNTLTAIGVPCAFLSKASKKVMKKLQQQQEKKAEKKAEMRAENARLLEKNKKKLAVLISRIREMRAKIVSCTTQEERQILCCDCKQLMEQKFELEVNITYYMLSNQSETYAKQARNMIVETDKKSSTITMRTREFRQFEKVYDDNYYSYLCMKL